MNKLAEALASFEHIESLARQDSLIHRLSPLIKLMSVLLGIIIVITTPMKRIDILMILIIVVLIAARIAQIPPMMIFKRALIGLPFSLCMGLSHILLIRDPVNVYGLQLSTGMLNCLGIILKTGLTLSLVLLLMATTTMDAISAVLLSLHVPSLVILQLEMTYRYIFVLVEEVRLMSEAYSLRSGEGIKMKDMGSFVGHVLIRATKRARDVDDAMILRGYDSRLTYVDPWVIRAEDVFLLLMLIGLMVIIKVVLQ